MNIYMNFKYIACIFMCLAMIMVFVKPSWACGFTPSGDWICDSPVANNGGTVTYGGSGGTNIIAGDPLPLYYPQSGLGDTSSIATLLSTMTGMFTNFDPCVQSVLLGHMSDVDSLSIDTFLLAAFMAEILNIQVTIDSMPDTISCPGGVSVPNRSSERLCRSISGFSLQDVIDSFGNNLDDGSAWSPTRLTEEACAGADSSNTGGTGGNPSTTAGPTGSCAPADAEQIRIDLASELETTEGRRECAYKDSVGKWTIGVGHLIIPSDPYGPGSCISQSEIDSLLRKDIDKHFNPAIAQMNEMGVNSDEFLRALAQVTFQLGPAWNTAKLPTGYRMMLAGDYLGAANWFEGLTCNGCWNASVPNGGTPNRVAAFALALRNLDNCVNNP